MTGGSTSYATTFYNYQNNQWSVGPQMILPRGYQAHTLLANGEVFCYGGSWSGGDQWDRRAEVWSPQSNTWRLLQDVPSAPAETRDVRGRYRADNHYWLYVAPNGNVRKVFVPDTVTNKNPMPFFGIGFPRRPQQEHALDYHVRQRIDFGIDSARRR